jgi:diguanylate cyclase (GGDEF)-like protein
VESTVYFRAEQASSTGPETSRHASANGSPPSISAEHPIMRELNSFRRELALARVKLEDIAADRASLVAKIEILERGIQSVHRIAHHDELTGLPSRRLLEDRYDVAVARSERQRDNLALLFIDIDEFKSINDSFGHLVGDGILRQFADRLVACIRASDTACRYGGDEFVVLLADNRARSDAAAVAVEIRKLMSMQFMVDAVALSVTASIGIALYPADGEKLSCLIRAADSDMYRVKDRGDLAMADDAFTNEGAPPQPTP